MRRPKRQSQVEGPLPMILTDRCQHNGCSRIALWAPELCIPVRGLAEVAPFKLTLGLELCPAHFYALHARAFLDTQVRGVAREAMKRIGVEPDFDAAYFTSLHVTSKEFRRFSRVAPNERVIFAVTR